MPNELDAILIWLFIKMEALYNIQLFWLKKLTPLHMKTHKVGLSANFKENTVVF